jgi:sugar lactone lactonase YvrE
MFLLALPACGGSGSSGSPDGGGGMPDSGACATAATGSIAVTVSGLPAGVNANVQVSGPGGMHAIQATTTLSAQTSGAYTFTASNVGDADPIVRNAYKAALSVSTGQLCDGRTLAVDVTYTLIPSSHKIWWGSSNSPSDTLAYDSSVLAASGSPAATVSASTQGAIPGAFDPDGNLWVLDDTAGAVGLKRYPANAIAMGGNQTPDVVVTSAAFEGGTPGPVSIAFDPDGNAWIGVLYSQEVVEIPSASLLASGAATPAMQISNVMAPNALAFDGKGNLWVGAGDSVVEYALARLTANISTAPDIAIGAQSPPPVTGPLTSVLGLAFNAGGELWVDFNGTLAKLTTVDLGASGTVTPAIQFTADVQALPSGLALDEGGGLWMAYSAGKVCRFGPTQLTGSGMVAPAVVLTSASVGSATSPVLFPAPASLPLYAALP